MDAHRIGQGREVYVRVSDDPSKSSVLNREPAQEKSPDDSGPPHSMPASA
jgi:hypothetical protein